LSLSKKVGEKIKGIQYSNFTDVLLGTKITAHILSGYVKEKNINSGVINKNYNVFGYKNKMVCDGSMISPNPVVNPSLSITAISEYKIRKISDKELNIF
jgi:cholesterol oxidase